MDFNQKPFLVIWEATRACDLACKHCRAKAVPEPDPDELTTSEAKAMLDAVSRMGTPIFVFSGGDPMKRLDIYDLVRHAKTRKLRVGLIPAVTPSLEKRQLEKLKEAGVDQVAFSLDAADAATHEALRQVPGTYARTLQAVEWAKEAGLPVQINTLINTHNFDDLDRMITLIESLGIVFWEVFFLVPTGRGEDLQLLTPEQFEAVFERLHEASRRNRFILKVTEGQHYRRYVAERERLAVAGAVPSSQNASQSVPASLSRPQGPGGTIGQAPRGVNSGKGFLFISRTGDIMPSGFLPIKAGNVRQDDLQAVYRDAPLFRDLRELSKLKGRCGRCEYADLCGGSRARAYAMTGDPFDEDPCCAYQPA